MTGASGFVGAHLVAHLTQCGDEFMALSSDVTDAQALTDELRGCPGGPPDVVYHLAGQADVGRSWTDVSLTWAVNTLGTVHLLEALRRCAPAARIVLVSSAEVYGKVPADELPILESRPTERSSPYGASKIAAEDAGLFAHEFFGQHVVIARPFGHIGVGQLPGFVVPAVAKQIVEAERDGVDVLFLGTLDAERDMTSVADVVRAYRLLAIGGVSGEAYNICRGETIVIRDVVERMIALSTRELRVELDTSRIRPSEIVKQYGDAAKIRAHTGWQPEDSLDAVLVDVLNEWRQRTTA